MQELNVHLVDDGGAPLDFRYGEVVSRLSRAFFAAFPKSSDPADVQNAVEESARRIARWERKHGQVHDLAPFFMRTFSNVVRSMFRRGYSAHHEAAASNSALERLAQRHRCATGSEVETLLTAREVLDLLDYRKRQIMIMNSEGFSPKEIAARLGITRQNVDTCLHRARMKVQQILAPQVLAATAGSSTKASHYILAPEIFEKSTQRTKPGLGGSDVDHFPAISPYGDRLPCR